MSPSASGSRRIDHLVAHLVGARRRNRPFARLRKDAGWIGQRLVLGRAAPTRIDLESVPRHRPAESESDALRLRIAKVHRETADAFTLVFEAAEGTLAPHAAGQFLSLELEVDGALLHRAYSFSSPEGGAPQVTIKRIPEGRVSGFLHANAEAGMELVARGPSGRFGLGDTAAASALVFIAGGSGITPIRSMIETALASPEGPPITLIYGNRSPADTIFADALEALEASQSRLTIVHVLEAPEGREGAIEGRPDAETLASLLPEDDGTIRYYVCGPTPMMDAARETLRARDVGADRHAEERFSSLADQTATGASEPVPVTITGAGRTPQTYDVQPGETLLEAAQRVGDGLPFSCAMGGCAACKVLCTSGEIVMDEPNCLTPAERESGAVLTCVARPLGPVTLEVIG